MTLSGKGPAGSCRERWPSSRAKTTWAASSWRETRAAPVVVSLAWGDGPGARQTLAIGAIGRDYKTFPFTFKAGTSTADARLEIVSSGRGSFKVGTASLMPADNVDGLRPESWRCSSSSTRPSIAGPAATSSAVTTGATASATATAARRARTRPGPASSTTTSASTSSWTFCRVIGTEPYIAVNSGLGDVAMALEEVEYANGAPDSDGPAAGEERAPPAVPRQVVGIGNEMYGNWQLGHMSLRDYVRKHNEFAVAMQAMDPSIKLVAVGDVGRWSERHAAECPTTWT